MAHTASELANCITICNNLRQRVRGPLVLQNKRKNPRTLIATGSEGSGRGSDRLDRRCESQILELLAWNPGLKAREFLSVPISSATERLQARRFYKVAC